MRAPLAERVVRDEAVLRAYRRRVRRVLLRRARQHREVRVAQDRAVAVVGLRGVGGGEPYEPGDLGRTGRVEAEFREGALGETGAALLVLGAVGAVDGVVEPGGEGHGRGVLGVGGQLVDAVEDDGEVGGGVVAALRFGPTGEEVLAVRAGVGALGVAARRGDQVGPAREQRGGGAGRVLGGGSHEPIVGYSFRWWSRLWHAVLHV
ncbi:hypothetical protein ADK38_10330 [Streptomyces varsoviensis]|uniref:Uncharacterized protein n=1 Tax=Streptomyces varsoviensis TaxID=67373 RepID=A0ABR5J9U2_9ACTN|nr:hypothetical protein ADK38_10330 [Streptomyces varsoviensis]